MTIEMVIGFTLYLMLYLRSGTTIILMSNGSSDVTVISLSSSRIVLLLATYLLACMSREIVHRSMVYISRPPNNHPRNYGRLSRIDV